MAKNLVIVESPAKAKTINKYLGNDYKVLASYGHVRDLTAKDGSVDPDDGFAMKWEVSGRASKTLKELTTELKEAEAVYLATDPDREGEAISWHLQEYFKEKKLLKDKQVYRVTFNEITKAAVNKAFEKPRDLDDPLIQAYLARRALDYLVGFNISPVLWRKLPGSKSAGRVQSVALRLICEREFEIEEFKAQEYWSIAATLLTPEGAPFSARLTHLAGNKLGKMDIGSEEQAKAAVARIENKALKIQKIEKKQVRRNPYAPFITSTLQQEAARKLGMSAQQTMRTAQKLYEGASIGGETVGLITYMRTDGTTLSEDAVKQCRDQIMSDFGKKYLPDAPRLFKSKAKNAQEAHEAIRPTDLSRTPKDVAPYLDDEQNKLYELIWKRTMASQMEQAVLDRLTADISDGTDDVVMRAVGSTMAFDGFMKLYREEAEEGQDVNEEDDNNDRLLPPMKEQDSLKINGITPDQHFTQPPPRFSEASLVKTLEEKGIGRPSTYASILQVLRDRSYVRMEKRRFYPEDRGRLVTAFLTEYFKRYVDYEFTANLEDQLDAISSGSVTWTDALTLFWRDFKAAVDATKDLTITEVLDHLDETLGAHFFTPTNENPEPRKCKSCDDGRLSLKLGKFGAFIGCSNYPECKFTRQLAEDDSEESAAAAKAAAEGPKVLGTDPKTGRTITLRKGPYGPYVQIDPPEEEAAKKGKKKEKPKRQGLPKGVNYDEVTLDVAVNLLALPRDIGKHPESGDMIQAGIGRYGPYLKHDGKFVSLPKDEDVLTVGINRAIDIIAEDAEKKKNKKKAAK
ncbi:MAG: DNA topoisomerase I [Alphaproteobacteria bacterium]|nr:DNA topoisomerase I [Alphaproteobacteria bacterium]|tara:strand:+ start:2990 stop:5383 length:2394 start_codon:yes stop_codon:yes gene_type:complete